MNYLANLSLIILAFIVVAFIVVGLWNLTVKIRLEYLLYRSRKIIKEANDALEKYGHGSD